MIKRQHGAATSNAPTLSILVPVLVLGMAGCSSFDERVQALEARTATLEAQNADAQTELARMNSQLVAARQELDNSLQPLRTQQADRGEDFRGLQSRITVQQEQIAMLENRIADLSERLASSGGGGQRRPDLGTALPPSRRQGGSAAPSPGPSVPQDENAASTLYMSAFNDYLREDYQLCVNSFREYINRYSSSDRADDAQYWIGECEDAQGNSQAALQAFSSLLVDYPDSEKVPDALFKDAVIRINLGDRPGGIEGLLRVVRVDASSDAAWLACRELGRLNVAQPAACDDS